MIGYVSGKIKLLGNDRIILVQGGIGYEILLPLANLITLKEDQSLELYIHTHVREDQITLYGFFDEKERQLFRKLISVSGVGPKSALGILSVATPSTIIRAIGSANADLFPKVPGVGKKTIEKLILDLKGSFDISEVTSDETDSMHDARLALETLGYTHKDISAVLTKLSGDMTMNEIIRQALQILSKTK